MNKLASVAYSKMTYPISLDEKIKNKFNLFKPGRDSRLDKIIYQKIYKLCFEELTKFLYENLSETERNQLLHQLKSSTAIDNKIKIIINYIKKKPSRAYLLNKKIDDLLDSIEEKARAIKNE